MNPNEILKMLQEQDYAVFGTGYVAGMLLKALEKQKALEHLRFFCRSEAKAGESFHTYPVLPLQEAESRGLPILLAVHDGNLASLPQSVRMIRVYPFLKDWLFGAPLRQELLRTAQIRQRQPEDQYWIAVRYAGIAGIKENDPAKKELYVRTMALHSSRETAEKRLLALEKLLQEAEVHGLDPRRPLVLDEDLRVIDGLHRLAVAAWCTIPEVQTVIYPRSGIYEELFDERNRLPEHFLRAQGISEQEIAYLMECKKRCG